MTFCNADGDMPTQNKNIKSYRIFYGRLQILMPMETC